jgi:hypothetical protein
MSKIACTSFHRNAVILFDAGQLRDNPAARAIRARFGAGLIRSFPCTRCEHTAQDAQEYAIMFAVPANPASMPQPRSLKEIMDSSDRNLAACASLLKTIDRHTMRMSGIRPICGGAPTKFEPSEDDLADVFGSDEEPVHFVPGDDDMAFVGACG